MPARLRLTNLYCGIPVRVRLGIQLIRQRANQSAMTTSGVEQFRLQTAGIDSGHQPVTLAGSGRQVDESYLPFVARLDKNFDLVKAVAADSADRMPPASGDPAPFNMVNIEIEGITLFIADI